MSRPNAHQNETPPARRRFVRLRSLALVLGTAGLFACGGSDAPAPGGTGGGFEPVANVVFVTIDTLRASKTEPYGHPDPITPSLARFASRSVQYDRAFTTMPTTAPAHLSMLTGLYPHQHGSLANGEQPHPHLEGLPSLLRREGRRTAAFVSVWHLTQSWMGLEGFETWDGPRSVAGGAVADGAVAVDRSIDWLRTNTDRPFFLWVHLFDPHWPYDERDDIPEGLRAKLAGYAADPLPKRGGFYRRVVPDRVARKLELLYEANVHHADRQVGRLLDYLQSSGLDRDTLTIVTSDHGEILREALASDSYGFDHGKLLLPEEVRVPLWVRLPRGGDSMEGRRVSQVVETRHLYGTTLAATGIETSGDWPVLPDLGLGDGRAIDMAFVMRRTFDAIPPERLARMPASARAALTDRRSGLITRDHLAVRIEDGERAVAVRVFDLEGSAERVEDVHAALGADAERIRVALDRWQREVDESGSEPSPGVDPEMREFLESLGYVR